MKKTLAGIIVWSLALAACGPIHTPPSPGSGPAPTPAPGPAFTERTIAVKITDGAAPIARCVVNLHLTLSGDFDATTDAGGYAAWLVKIPNPDPGGGLNARVHIACPNFDPLDDSFVIAPLNNQDITFGGTKAEGNQPMLRPGPVSSRPRLITVADSPQIRGNFASSRDRTGRLIFQVFVGRLWLDGKLDDIADWMANAKAQGLTYFNVGLQVGAYPGYPLDGFDMRGDLPKFAQMLTYLQRFPAADGGAFRFVVYHNDGSSGFALDYVNVGNYADALRAFDPYIVPTPAFETVGGCSDWGTAFNLAWQKAIAAAWHNDQAGVHGCPGRLALSSNPLEATDLFHGDEPSSFSSHGGELPRYFLFQFEHGRSVTDSCVRDARTGLYPDTGECGMNRADDVIARAGAGICSDSYGHGGLCGWRNSHSARPLFPVMWEGCTMDLYHGNTDLACDERLANEALEVFEFYGVTPMFGSGLPTTWRPKTSPLFAATHAFTFTFTQR